MTNARPPKRRFVRLYYDDLENDYPEVYFDPTCYSTYARLLDACDKAWPSLPELPAAIRRADLAKLRTSTLLEIQPNHRFMIKGYAKERAERESKAKKAAGHRWDASADAVA